MRKFTAVLLSTMFVLGSFTSVMAQDSDTKQTTISVSVDPTYMVTIPANTTIKSGEQSSSLGKITIENVRLEPDKSVNVAVDASGKLKNTKDTSKTIHYKLMNGDKEFKSASYTENSDNTMLTLLNLLINQTGIKHMPVHIQIHLYLLFRTDSEYM